MTNVPINLPPGLFQNGTQYAIKDRWFDGNMIRWVNNEMQPIGGWTLFGTVAGTTEPIRAIYSYIDNTGKPWYIYGTADKLFAADDSIPLTFYDITPTTLAYNPGGQIGYGSKAYGTGIYGSRRPTSVEISAGAIWNFNNYGELLIASHSQDGRVFSWNPNTPATVAAPFVGPNVPTSVIDIVVTNERHVMAFGTGDDPRAIQWADRDNPSDWDYTSTTNTAGRFVLQSKGVIITALKVFNGVLVLTDEDAHLIYFVGGSAIYATQVIGSDNCGAISNKSPVAIPDGAVWPGQASFWFYNGSVQRLPCDLLESFYGGNLTQPEEIHGGYNEKFNEVWWFRPKSGSITPDEAFVWSKRDRPYWTRADITRNAIHHIALQDEPFMSQGQNIFLHEVGYTDNGSQRANVFAETGVIQLGQGDRVMHCRKIYQDAEFPLGSNFPYQIMFKISQAPGAQYRNTANYVFNDRGYTNARFRARQAIMRVEQLEDIFWQNGEIRLDLIPGGMR